MTEHEAIAACKKGCCCYYDEVKPGLYERSNLHKDCPFHAEPEKEKKVMPKKYEAIRDKFVTEGKSPAVAKTSAAKIYNSTRKSGQAPVTGKHKGK